MAQNSLLTDAQREFLRTPKSEREEKYVKQQRSYHRQNIRKRFEAGVEDFTLLFEGWEEDEREAVFETPSEDFDRGMTDMIALVYHETFLGGRFKNLLLRGVNRAEKFLAGSETVRVRTNFEVERISEIRFERALEKFKQGNLRDLTDDEAQALIYLLRQSGPLSHKDFETLLGDYQNEVREAITDAEREGRRNRREKQQ